MRRLATLYIYFLKRKKSQMWLTIMPMFLMFNFDALTLTIFEYTSKDDGGMRSGYYS